MIFPRYLKNIKPSSATWAKKTVNKKPHCGWDDSSPFMEKKSQRLTMAVGAPRRVQSCCSCRFDGFQGDSRHKKSGAEQTFLDV